MKTQRRTLLRIVAAALALLATITWSTEAMAATGPATSTTVYAAPSIDAFERVVTPLPKDEFVTTFSVGWGGGS